MSYFVCKFSKTRLWGLPVTEASQHGSKGSNSLWFRPAVTVWATSCCPHCSQLKQRPGIFPTSICVCFIQRVVFPARSRDHCLLLPYCYRLKSFCPPLLQNRWVQMQLQLQMSVLTMCEQHQAKEDWVQTWAGQRTPNEQLTSPCTSPQSAANTPSYDRTRRQRQLNPHWDRLTTF